MLGAIVYFGVNRLIDFTEENDPSRQRTAFAKWAVRLHVGSFAAYSLLLGFLIAKLGAPRIEHIALVTLAMAPAMARHYVCILFSGRRSEEYGDFLIAIYEDRVRHDAGMTFVMNFEWALNP